MKAKLSASISENGKVMIEKNGEMEIKEILKELDAEIVKKQSLQPRKIKIKN